jgi:hypothetical protein
MWNSKSSVAVSYFLPGRVKDLSAPLYFSAKGKYIEVSIMDHLKDKIPELFVDTNALSSFTSLVPSTSGLSLQSVSAY